MTEPKHTPGPWKTQYNEFAKNWVVRDGLDRLVASTSSSHMVDTRPGSPYLPEVGEANALLIAAAPQTLEALKLAEKTIARVCEILGVPQWDTHLTEIRAAIAKAEGR